MLNILNVSEMNLWFWGDESQFVQKRVIKFWPAKMLSIVNVNRNMQVIRKFFGKKMESNWQIPFKVDS